ncbi:hypothetical protein TWF694_007669 [Orbilia ellipsospora]|uniref:F-box domain-containing protein n=1 Tax=Orbilia ellipsospora TaxID=2528407 RepID=A0AAV9XII6_9PEZI
MDGIKDTCATTGFGEPQQHVGDAHTNNCEIRLFNVPLEIVQEIVSYLENVDLLNLALVSWKANEVSVGKLYEKILFTTRGLRTVDKWSHSLYRTDAPNRNLRHVRSVGVEGSFEDAGFWLVDLPAGSLEAISLSLGGNFEKFIRRLEPGAIREIIWRTELIFSESIYKYLAESQKNINSIEFGRLSIPGPIELLDVLPLPMRDEPLDLEEYCCQLLSQGTLVNLKVDDIRGFEELKRLVEVIYQHRYTLKHIAIKMLSFETERAQLMEKQWKRSTFEDALETRGISPRGGEDIFLPKVESFRISGFKLSETESADLSSLLGPILDMHRVSSLEIYSCGHLRSTIWPQMDTCTQSRLTTLHVDAYGITDMVYKFLENTETSCRLVELRVFIWTEKEERYPDLQHHANSLRKLFLVMTKQAFPPLQCPITTESWNQMMAMPKLTEFAVTLHNTPAQPIKITMPEGAFPSLRALWIMTPDTYFGNSVPFIYFEKESSQQEGILDDPEKTYPPNLEVIGVTMRYYASIPEQYFVRWQENKPLMANYRKTMQKPKDPEHEYDFVRNTLATYHLFEIFQVLM